MSLVMTMMEGRVWSCRPRMIEWKCQVTNLKLQLVDTPQCTLFCIHFIILAQIALQFDKDP